MPDAIGLVLAGGGARGAYEAGVLRALLPALAERGERPGIVVGTSVGALNAAYLATNADVDAATLADNARKEWLSISYSDVLEPFLSLGELATAWRLPLGVVDRRVLPFSLLDPKPLRAKLEALVDSGKIHDNVAAGHIACCAVVATAAHTNRSVVFHEGGPDPQGDERRGIDYVRARLSVDHVLASAAIPVAFPAVHVEQPPGHTGWYFDGGTRLNTPIKPALELGADRVIVIGLNSLAPAEPSEQRADLFDGASQLVQGLLVDPLINDIETLAQVNESLGDAGAGGGRRVVPYIFVAPREPNAIGRLARRVYERSYGSARDLLGGARDLYLLGRLVGANRNTTRAELFSYLFFAHEFAQELLELGEADARRWLAESHEDGVWHVGPLPRG
jgi:NTE family protein